IIGRRHIVPANVVAHSDIAPDRKADPGERFPWERLAKAGLADFVAPVGTPGRTLVRPGERGVAVAGLQAMLSAYGYGVEQTGCLDERTVTVIKGFQRRFRPQRIDGMPDRSTLDTLKLLLETFPPG